MSSPLSCDTKLLPEVREGVVKGFVSAVVSVDIGNNIVIK